MTGRCKECLYWGATESGYRPFKEGFNRCERIESELDQDGEPFGGKAAIATPETFGCVLFEVKA